MSNKQDKKEDVVIRYSKAQWLASARFKDRADALGAIVKDDEMLTLAEVTARLDGFMKGAK